MADLEKIKFEIIDAKNVPTSRSFSAGKWFKVFNAIPKGKAAIIKGYGGKTVYMALRNQQTKGRFRNLRCVTRKLGDEKTAYIINLDGAEQIE